MTLFHELFAFVGVVVNVVVCRSLDSRSSTIWYWPKGGWENNSEPSEKLGMHDEIFRFEIFKKISWKS